MRRLDEQDIANARLIAAVPRLLAAMQRLTDWADSMGGWDAACWAEAAAILASLRSS